MRDEVKLIIFTHGYLSDELLKVAKLVVGESVVDNSGITSLSNSNLSLAGSVARIIEIVDSFIDENENVKIIIATDFPGGSCFMASKKVAKELHRTVSTITGLNISMILSFVTKKNDKFQNLEQFTKLLKEDGIRAVKF